MSYPQQCKELVLSQLGSLRARPEVLAAPSLPKNFPDIAELLGKTLETNGISLSGIAEFAKQNKTTKTCVSLLINTLCGGNTPLVELVFRYDNGERCKKKLCELIGTDEANKVRVTWEKVMTLPYK